MHVGIIVAVPSAAETVQIGLALKRAGQEVWAGGLIFWTIPQSSVGQEVTLAGPGMEADTLIVSLANAPDVHELHIYSNPTAPPGHPDWKVTLPAQPLPQLLNFTFTLPTAGSGGGGGFMRWLGLGAVVVIGAVLVHKRKMR